MGSQVKQGAKQRGRTAAFSVVALVLVVVASSCATEATRAAAPAEPTRTVSSRLAVCVDNGASAPLGDGSDGVYAPLANGVFPTTATTAQGTAGSTSLTVGSSAGFAAGDRVLVHQTIGTGSGTWEIGAVAAAGPTTLTLALPLLASYSSVAPSAAQAVRVAQFTTVTIAAPRVITAAPWNGQTGGIVAFFANTSVTVAGTLRADGAGYRGGAGDGGNNTCLVAPKAGVQGESSVGPGAVSTMPNGAGGGGGQATAPLCCSGCPAVKGTTGDSGGGGGGYGTAGTAGQGLTPAGQGGTVAGTPDLTSFFFGGGGGGGGGNCLASSPPGAAGGGAIFIAAPTVSAPTGAVVSARGANATINGPNNWEGGGGGGAGGSILISARTTTLGTTVLNASGGNGSVQCAGAGGNGGVGRVRVACATLNGAACPTDGSAASTPAPDVTGFCAFNGCSANADCPAATPVCDPATRACVACEVDADCGAMKVCDTAKHTCGACAPGKLANCMGTTPTCDPTPMSDVCAACNGNFGAATTRPCPAAGSPICVTSGPNAGACAACNTSADCAGTAPVCLANNTCGACSGDSAVAATNACPSGAMPYCLMSGACGKCGADTDCTAAGATHAGPFCNVGSGACSSVCLTDAECGAGNWCNDLSGPGACQPTVPNGQAVPGGTCTMTLGARACVSAVCDTADNRCGYANGDGPCTGSNGAALCRSMVCATSGALAGKCEQCASDANCTAPTPACDAKATCVQCTPQNATACTTSTPACNAVSETCSACNGDNGSAATLACPTAADPYCGLSGGGAGRCGKCAINADCGAMHNGSICNPVTGACGAICLADSDCGLTQWCSQGACAPKVANGQPLPAAPPISGMCTMGNGARVCLSGVCDADNLCGYANGGGSCTSLTAAAVCRSSVCATAGANQGKCVACNVDGDCSGAMPACDTTRNVCVQCTATNSMACPAATPVCDNATETCVAADAGAGDAGHDASDAGGAADAPLDSNEAGNAGDASQAGDGSDGGGTQTGDGGDAGDASNAGDGANASDGGDAGLDTGTDTGAGVDTGFDETGSDVEAGFDEAGNDDSGPANDATDDNANAMPSSDTGSAPQDKGSVEGGGFSCALARNAQGSGGSAATLLVLIGLAFAGARRRTRAPRGS